MLGPLGSRDHYRARFYQWRLDVRQYSGSYTFTGQA